MEQDRHIEPEGLIEIQAQIPVFVRALFYSAFRISPLKEVGKSFYQFAARRIAYSLMEKGKGLSVFLFGGTVDRCIPAISDLDFLILKQKQFTKEELWEIRGSYFELKRRFPLLGEIHLSQKSNWNLLEESNFAVQLWFSNKQKFRDGKFQNANRTNTKTYSNYSRLGLCIHHYQKAQRYLLEAFQNKSVSRIYLAHFSREISKALSWTDGHRVKLERPFSPAFLMAKALYQIHALARTLPLDSRKEAHGISLGIEKNQVQQFLTSVTNREHLVKLHQYSDELGLLKNSPVPFALSIADNLSFSGALRIMNSYVSYLEKMAGEEKFFPILLTESMLTFTSYGWNWGEGLSHLAWATPYHLEDPVWVRNLKRHTQARLSERILLNMNLIMGKLVCAMPERILVELKILSREIIWLGTGEFECRDSILIKEGKKEFPFAHQALQLKLDRKPLVGMGELFELCLGLCSEAHGLMSKRV